MDLSQAEAVAGIIMAKSRLGVKNSLNQLNSNLKTYGKKVLLTYGRGSIKRNGILIRRAGLKLNFKNVLYSAVFFGLGYVTGAVT